MMKVMIVREPGPVGNFEAGEMDRPSLQAGHLLIEVRATSVNPIDTKVRARQFPGTGEDTGGPLRLCRRPCHGLG